MSHRVAAGLVVLVVLVAVGVGARVWQAGTLKSAVGLGAGLGDPKPAQADEPPARLTTPTAALVSRMGSMTERTLARAADNAALELAGSGDGSVVGWLPVTGLWSRPYTPKRMPRGWKAPQWWQSALSFTALVRYLQQTQSTQAGYQQLIDQTHALNIVKPHTREPRNFANQFMDDTAWWGIGWLAAARYELTIRHDTTRARRYLRLAEADARYVFSRPRACHSPGIEWQVDYPPDTIVNEEFVAFAAQLAAVRTEPGPLRDRGKARAWLADARTILGWLEGSGLVDMTRGTVADRLNGRCHVTGGPVTYTEGEMVEALTQMGVATHNPMYFTQAQPFISRALSPGLRMIRNGVLQQPCEAMAGRCVAEGHAYDSSSYKGIFVEAVADFTQATQRPTYAAWLVRQGEAVIRHAASDGRRATRCGSPHRCQLDFYWSRRVLPTRLPIQITPGSQEAGLAALTAAAAAAARVG